MTRLVRLAGTMLLLFYYAPLFAQCDCITTGNCPVSILDNATFQGTLDVSVGCDNDLAATPLTQVCFQIEHSWVGDLSVSLTSPAGLNYLLMADLDNALGGCGTDADNIDVCIDVGVGNPLTNNTEYICNSLPCVFGTCCLAGSFTAPCGGVSDPVSGAAQAPNCDLNDFNQAGHPVNGTWTMTINDVCQDDQGQLLNFSLEFDCPSITCFVCEAEGGSLDADDVTTCFGDPSLNLNLQPTYNSGEIEPPVGDYSYAYVITQNGTIMSINPTSDLSAQPPGTYQVCGLSYLTLAIGDIQSMIGMNQAAAQNMLSGTTAPFCADFSSDCITVTIGNLIPPSVLDTFACLGECVFIQDSHGNDVEVCSSGDVILDSYLGCDSVVTVIIEPIFVESTTVDTTLCSGECLTINNEVYCPPGPHILILENVFGCDSIITYFITEEITEAHIIPNPPPVLDCDNPSVALDGSSSIPANVIYNWSGPNNFSSSDPTVVATIPGEYHLTIENTAISPSCIAETSITVSGNIAEPALALEEVPPAICAGADFNLLDLEITDTNNTTAIITYHSASPATTANELDTTLVTPLSTTTYYILATTSGNCTDELAVEIEVTPLPLADFTLTPSMCVTETATITYTGTPDTSATYSWNFGGGVATPGTGPGPHSVTWPTGGIKTVTLSVTANGCTSTISSQTIDIAPPLPEPVANCNPATNSIEFVWNPVPGAANYNITVAIGPNGIMTSDTSYLIAGLSSGELASIFIEAISGNACVNTITQISCTAQECPMVDVTIDPIPDICLDGTQAAFPLTAVQTGGDGTGIYTFTGPGVNPISGTFNPNNANLGPNNILVTYEEGTCAFNTSTIINVFEVPMADFTATLNICSDASSTITYTGNASSDANFIWDFDGGMAVSGTGIGPYEVSWPTSGEYTVSLTVEENGCTAETTFQTITVDQAIPTPAIYCDASTSSILFYWEEVPGAQGYIVNTINGTGGIMTSDTSILFDNLTPNSNITVEVVAENTGLCGSSTEQLTCTANNCEDVLIQITPVNDICLDSTLLPFDLAYAITGGLGNGTLIWSGPGITDTLQGTFDPMLGSFGENIITAHYSEGNCFYEETLSIFIYALPIAGFTSNAPVCEGEPVTIMYTGPALPGLDFSWNFGTGTGVPGTGIGPHEVTWPDAGTKDISLVVENSNGCLSEVFETSIQIDLPLLAPIISCSSTPASIDFIWPVVTGATDYQVEVLSGHIGTFIPPNSYSFDGLSPNEEVSIELTVTGNGNCPSVTTIGSCTAIDCPPIDLTILPEAGAVCVNTPNLIDFELVVIGGGTDSIVWSGAGITDVNEGLFNPGIAGIGQHIITALYTDGNCSYQSFTSINVIDEPTADFTIAPIICAGDGASFTYTGNAGNTANYNWSLDGGVLDPASQTIAWDLPGTYTLSLEVEQDGCISMPFFQDVEVMAPLAEPIVLCNATDASIEFSWPPVTGATDYQINVVSGQSGSYIPPGTYVVDGLLPGEEVTIEITTIGGSNICPPITTTAQCMAEGCPDIFLTLTPLGPLCEDGQHSLVPLEAIATGGSGNGMGNWTGPGVTNNQFDPTAAGVGNHLLTYTYEENPNCIYIEEMTIEVLAPPIADAGTDGFLSCQDDEMEVTLGGAGSSTGNHISYSWAANFGAFPGDSTILHPIVSVPGTYTLTVTNADLNCSSSTDVIVEASQETPFPLISITPISCHGNNDGALSVTSVSGGIPPYMYSLNGVPYSSNSFFTQLAPGVYDLAVLDANGCENMLTVNMIQPQELNVELVVSIEGDNNVIVLGETANMTAVVNVPEDSLEMIQWEPADEVNCDTCINITANPVYQTTFSITVEDNGCTDSDAVTIFVSKERNVYVPTGFSPNGDNINDVFMPYVDIEQAVKIKSFLVFNRWGETVYQYYNFTPNDPTFGWDGRFRNQALNPGIYTWFAEIEFIDGLTQVFKGDVTMTR